jgi:chromosome segregation ATPase
VTTHEDQSSTTSGKPNVEQLQADIEHTREELAETVEALTAKLDVKSRARDRLDDTKARARAQVADAQARAKAQIGHVQTRAKGLTTQARGSATTDDGKPAPTVLAGAAAVTTAVLVATGLFVWRRRR